MVRASGGCARPSVSTLFPERHTSIRYTCFDLFGFDILLDEKLKPWLLEVNISPSLRPATPVDHAVKSAVVKDMLNLVGFQLSQQLKDDLDERLLHLSPTERLKHRHYKTILLDVEEETTGILENLTPDDVRVLVQRRLVGCREHDKGPEEFVAALRELQQLGLRFHVSFLGQNFTELPSSLVGLHEELGAHVLHWGPLPDRDEYLGLLRTADVAVSTAHHEFYGVAMLEASLLGCYPLCPNRLVYPEIFP
ncbi:hypothetical protein V5799_014906, partial [Amblyomma americanum]